MALASAGSHVGVQPEGDDGAGELIRQLLDPHVCIPLVAFLAILNLVGTVVIVAQIKKWVIRQDWWPNAEPLQKNLMKNFGYKEDKISSELALQGFSWVICVCGNHWFTGIMCSAVIVSSSPTAYAMFLIGALFHMGYEISDEIRLILTTFKPAWFPWFEPTPLPMFFIMGIGHHPLAIAMIMPMLFTYLTLPSFHNLVVSLLLAAGISYALGCYKFTLNANKPGELFRYKVVVVLQLAVILYTRGYVWFVNVVASANTFAEDGRDNFWWGIVICGVLMTFFNVALVLDAVEAAVKWLPRKAVDEAESYSKL